MKGLTKTIVALTLVVAVLATMGMSAMAATYTTKTTYNTTEQISVTATASDLKPGDIVTFVATTDEDDIDEDSIVYIDQDEVNENAEPVVFNYTTNITNINASMFFGGSTETEGRKVATRTDDYVINVTIDGEATDKVVYAAKQADNIDGAVIRKFDLTGIASFAGLEVTGVSFTAEEGTAEDITNFCVAENTLIVSTAVINANGTLYITTTGTDHEEPVLLHAEKIVESDKLVVLAKAVSGTKFGIAIYEEGVGLPIDGGFAEEEGRYVILPALGKNVEGIYAIEVEGVSTILEDSFKVCAYANSVTDGSFITSYSMDIE